MKVSGMLNDGQTKRLNYGDKEVTFGRIGHFGNWLRIVCNLPKGAERRLHVTFHFKG